MDLAIRISMDAAAGLHPLVLEAPRCKSAMSSERSNLADSAARMHRVRRVPLRLRRSSGVWSSYGGREMHRRVVPLTGNALGTTLVGATTALVWSRI